MTRSLAGLEYLLENGWEQTEKISKKIDEANHFELHHKELDIFTYYEAARDLQYKLDQVKEN